MARMTITDFQTRIGVTADNIFGPASMRALDRKFANVNAPAATVQDFRDAAAKLGVPITHIRGVRAVEAPRGPFDTKGRPSALYERHKFRNNTVPVGRFNASHPALSGPAYGPGGYGSFDSQWAKFAAACALDPEAALRACSWGAFQVLGENAEALGYSDAFEMLELLATGEAAHLDSFVRFVETNHLVEKFRACKPNDAGSCVPFVSVYNGRGYKQFNYDVKLAHAIA